MYLASVQKITNISPIQGADLIEVATVLGWQVVVKKGEYRIGDSCSYIQIDTIVPELPEYEFLRLLTTIICYIQKNNVKKLQGTHN